MPDDDPDTAPFNEQGALEELERLQRDLEESRQRRKDASAAFDEFVGSFGRGSAGATRTPKGPAQTSGARDPAQYRSRLSPILDAPAELAGRPAARKLRVPLAGVVAGGAIALVAGALLTRGWRSASSESPEPPTAGSGSAAVGAPVLTSSPAAQSTSGTANARGVGAELIALRPVWVRAIVDGERAVERELEAEARVPLRAVRTIVIRAGDAGAVRLTIDGQDQGVLGRDGVVATRTFTVK